MITDLCVIELAELCITVTYKDIKNIHLSVHPPYGRVTVAAPMRMELESIRLFCIAKLGWIRKQQMKLRSQKRETAREYVTRESHYYLGQRYLLKVIDEEAASKVVLKHSVIELHIRPGSTKSLRDEVLKSWYRSQLRALVAPYIAAFEMKMKVSVNEVQVRSMKTKWGTCNPQAKRIWLNTELAKKSPECIEYIVAHEMVHLLERHHNPSFIAYMDMYLPKWRHIRDDLNRSALGHVEWGY